MNAPRRIVKSVIPGPVRRLLRTMHREFIFWKAMRRFLRDPAAAAYPGSPILADLIYGWGNEVWSALDEYLVGCIHHALATRQPILECGSGLSTILLGAIAQRQGQSYWALEHLPEWAMKVERYLKRYGIHSVVLCVSDLKDYGEFCWYTPPLDSMPKDFALIVCDGPPGTTRGGRYGVVPIMRKRLASSCTILLDDADREQEMAIAQRWQTELNASLEVVGQQKRYVELVMVGERVPSSANQSV